MSPSLITAALAQTDLFRELPESVMNRIVSSATVHELRPGEVLLSPQIENQHVYVLLSGQLGVHLGKLESPSIRELEAGASVGEMSIIESTLPSAYVVASQPSSVFPIHSELIHTLVSETSPFGRNLVRLLIHLMKANTQRIVQDLAQIGELSDQADVDALTGLYNRRWLNSAIVRLMERAQAGKQPLCVLLLDVDHFKKYNDAHGHLGGDQALTAMGHILKTAVRPADFACRYGGEEFMVLLPHTAREGALAAAERIRHATERQAITASDGSALPGITVSIGMAVIDANATPESLIAAADAQLYRAKAEGRNCVR
jgi:diguanylate cyclase (GGDEF)-like protein